MSCKNACKLQSRQEKQRKESGGQKLGVIAAEINDQQGVGIGGVANGREKRCAPRQQAASESEGRQASKGLHQNDECDGYVVPRNKKAQRGSEQPGKRGIENEARFTETVIGPFGPARVKNSLLPLGGDVEPGGCVKFEVVPRGDAKPEKWSHDQEGSEERKRKRKRPPTGGRNGDGGGVLRKLGFRSHSALEEL